MKAKKVAAGIVVLVLVIVSVLYGVVEYNYKDKNKKTIRKNLDVR